MTLSNFVVEPFERAAVEFGVVTVSLLTVVISESKRSERCRVERRGTCLSGVLFAFAAFEAIGGSLTSLLLLATTG